MTDAPEAPVDERPLPGSHARDVPSGTLEESAATLHEAALAARDAEGSDDPEPLHAFYRAFASAVLLLPVPPGSEADAREAAERVVDESAEVDVGVLLARGPDGEAVSVVFGSNAALAAWSPLGSSPLALPARIALPNLASAGLSAILDPAGPIPYRFEPDELADLAAGRLPGTETPLFQAEGGTHLRVRLPGADGPATEQQLAAGMNGWPGLREAYLVEADLGSGWTTMVGLVGGGGALPPLPDGLEGRWLAEPLLGGVRAVAEPFYRAPR